MDKIIREVFELKDVDADSYSPLTLAYIGDCVYELTIRTLLVNKGNAPVNKLNKKASDLAKAPTQSKMISMLVENELLTEDELAVYKRGRNAKSFSTAKNATVSDYRRATGFEALMGWLYLRGESRRALEIIKLAFDKAELIKLHNVRKQHTKFHNCRTNIANERSHTMRYEEYTIEGRNAVIEAFRSGKTIDKLYVLDGCQDGPIKTIVREAKKGDTIINFVTKERLDEMSQTGHHQGAIAKAAAYEYAEVSDILEAAREKGEPPFILLLDGIEDPHNLGAIIRTANLAGAHGVIIPKRRAVGLTAVVAKTSAGAINYTPVAKVTNLASTIDDLKKEGMWFVCADMGGELMYRQNLTGPIGLVIGNEGEGVSRLIKEKCDFITSIPMKGDIDSLNASVAAGVLSYEIVRQRMMGK